MTRQVSVRPTGLTAPRSRSLFPVRTCRTDWRGLNPLSPPHSEHIGSGATAIGHPSATRANDALADTQSSRFRRHHGQLELQTSAAFTAGNIGKVFRHEVLGAEVLD